MAKETTIERKARQAAYVAKWRKNNPEKQKLARLRTYLNRKRKVFNLLGGAFCAKCGCDELSFLEINHINGGGSKEWRSRRGNMHDYLLSGKRNTNGLNVLCRVCNAIDYLKNKNPEAIKKYKLAWTS